MQKGRIGQALQEDRRAPHFSPLSHAPLTVVMTPLPACVSVSRLRHEAEEKAGLDYASTISPGASALARVEN